MKRLALAILAAFILTSCGSVGGFGRPVTDLDAACQVWRDRLPVVSEDAPLADLQQAARQVLAYEEACGSL
jgi:predicted small secreted protein